MKNHAIFRKQNGATTLLTALIILISITLVTLLTAKTSLVETQISASNYQMSQAFAAANAGMDFAMGYFDGSASLGDGSATADGKSVAGFDHNKDGNVDVINQPNTLCYNYGNQTSRAIVRFDNSDDDDVDNDNDDNPCVTAGALPSMKGGMIEVMGCSDLTSCTDACTTAENKPKRIIRQCVGTIDVFGGNAPKQPLVAKGAVNLGGSISVINRFNNTTVWSGEPMSTNGSAETYLRRNGTAETDFDPETELEDPSPSNEDYTSPPITEWQQGSDTKGLGVDVIADDPRLSTLTGDQFFNNFFFTDRNGMYDLAKGKGQVHSAIPNPNDAEGIFWVGPAPCGHPDNLPCPALQTYVVNGNSVFGSRDSPVIMIVNGNVDPGGSPQIWGMLYVIGSMAAGSPGGGNFRVFGSALVEDPSGVANVGDVELIYTPYTLEKSTNPIIGTTTVVSGSWRDW